MRFGAVPLSEAEGAILAHSVQLTTGRLRKGLYLTADHLHQLAGQATDARCQDKTSNYQNCQKRREYRGFLGCWYISLFNRVLDLFLGRFLCF